MSTVVVVIEYMEYEWITSLPYNTNWEIHMAARVLEKVLWNYF